MAAAIRGACPPVAAGLEDPDEQDDEDERRDRADDVDADAASAHGGLLALGAYSGTRRTSRARAARVPGVRFRLEADPIALPVLVDPAVPNGRLVEEDVAVAPAAAAVRGDEAEALVDHDALDGSGCHGRVLLGRSGGGGSAARVAVAARIPAAAASRPVGGPAALAPGRPAPACTGPGRGGHGRRFAKAVTPRARRQDSASDAATPARREAGRGRARWGRGSGREGPMPGGRRRRGDGCAAKVGCPSGSGQRAGSGTGPSP